MTSYSPLTSLGETPSRQNPATFAPRASAIWAALRAYVDAKNGNLPWWYSPEEVPVLGSNGALGSYLRLPTGVQVCWAQREGPGGYINSAIGSDLFAQEREPFTTWEWAYLWPAAFDPAWPVHVFAASALGGRCIAHLGADETGLKEVAAWAGEAQSGIDIDMTFIAIGRYA